MDNSVFENLLIADFYIRYQEGKSKFEISKLNKLFKKVKKEVCTLEETLLIDDRDKKSEAVKEKLFSLFSTSGELYDTEFYSLLHEDADWEQVIKLLAQIIKQDGIISTKEKEVILKLSQKYNIDIVQTKQLLKNRYTKKQKLSIWAASMIALLIIVFGAGAWIVNNIEKKKMAAFNIENYVKQNPKLIFKTIQFSKFIVHGKPDGTNEHLDKLNILHLKGNADLYIDMSCLKVDSGNTDNLQKKLCLIYDSHSKFPVSVDVDIPSGDYTLVEEIEPAPISEREAEAIAKPVGVITGGIGALIGGNIGSKLGSALSPIGKLGKFIGGGAGAATGAAVAGIGGYVYTKDFLMGLNLTGNELEDKESIIHASKGLVALEIMGGNLLSEPDYDSKLQQYYQEECKRQLIEIMKTFGWQKVEIKFNYE